MYTRLLCVTVGLKLTHLATASIMRNFTDKINKRPNTDEIKQDVRYTMYIITGLVDENDTIFVCKVALVTGTGKVHGGKRTCK